MSNKKIFFFYVEKKIETNQSVMTGAQIKAAIKAEVPDFDMAHDLILEGRGHDPDKLIKDTDSVDLEHGHGGGPKHFFSRPPANFG